MAINNLCIIGGSGFVGRHIAAQAAALGIRVTIPTRQREKLKSDLILLPTVDLVDTDVHDPVALSALLRGQDAVINLVGILQGDEAAFERAHVELPGKIIAACKANGIQRLLHMSALKADANGPSRYLRSKGRGEALVQQSGLDYTIFQPSVIFGRGDSFLNLFAKLARVAPVLPLGGAEAQFQPVWVEDVARCFIRALDHKTSYQQSYPLCGPQRYSLRQLVHYTASLGGCPRPIFALPDGLARLQAGLLELLPGQLMSRDNLDSMSVASTCDCPFPAVFGFSPTALEAVAPAYLANTTPRGRYQGYRSRTGQ